MSLEHGSIEAGYKGRVHSIKYRGEIVPTPMMAPALTLVPNESAPKNEKEKPKDKSTEVHRIRWAQLLKRVFNIDVETCPHCGGSVRIIAAIEDPTVIKKILSHLGMATKPPLIHGPRAPPHEFNQDLFQNFGPEYDS